MSRDAFCEDWERTSGRAPLGEEDAGCWMLVVDDGGEQPSAG